MEALAPFHPSIVHFPVALLLAGALFELIGRATDLAWWRRAALAMLVAGALGAWGAVLSGQAAEELAEHQGVAESVIDAHADVAKLTAWLASLAVVARAAAGRMGGARAAVAGLALLLQLASAATVGLAGYRGGKLVYEHGAGVRSFTVRPGVTISPVPADDHADDAAPAPEPR